MRLELTRGAQDDLLDIARFIGEDDPAAARKLVVRLKARARLAARTPLAGRLVPEWPRADLREALIGTYRIIYLVRPRAASWQSSRGIGCCGHPTSTLPAE